jgi:hypothetical protein
MFSIGRTAIAIAASALMLGGCAENAYLYRPAQQATAVVSGLPAARYPVPAERPTGEVLVLSSGVTEIKPSDVPTRALFVRLVVTNNSDDAAWGVDTRRQIAVLGGQRISPSYVNAYGQALPVIQVPRGDKRTIDLYYPVPAGMESNGDVPQFDVAWNIQTSGRLVAERTSFDRMRVEPAYVARGPYGYGYYGYGPGWPYPYYGYGWYDPFWGPRYGIGIHSHWGYGGYYGGHYGGHYGWGGGFGGGGHGVGRPSYFRAGARPR